MWRPAKSLTTLLNQVNQAYPNRNKASDGLVGDSSHQAQPSDHNPNSARVVCALDLTHDPKHFNAHKCADNLVKKPHSNGKYIISNRRIAQRLTGWKWEPYYGSDPHDTHIHISVGVGPDGKSIQPYDSTTKWNIKGNEEEMLTNKDHLKALTRQFLGKDPTADTKKYLGKPYSYAIDKFTKARVDLPSLLKENAKLKKLLAQAGDPTSNDQAVKDGLYDKIKKVFGK